MQNRLKGHLPAVLRSMPVYVAWYCGEALSWRSKGVVKRERDSRLKFVTAKELNRK